MMQLDHPIVIEDWFAWKPGRETRDAWRDWAGQGLRGQAKDADGPVGLPMMLRRRIDSFGQKVIGAALRCDDVQNTRYIFASRHGEFARTLRILAALADGETPSPADFSMSIHHALAGLLSIHSRNKAAHTTISAGRDTFGFAMLEAAASLAAKPEEPVLLVCYDEPLSGDYRCFDDEPAGTLPFILVLKLASPVRDIHGEWEPFRFSVEAGTEARQGNAVEDFLRFFLSGEKSASSAGERMTWRWHRAA